MANGRYFNSKRLKVTAGYILLVMLLTHIPKGHMPLELGGYGWGDIGLDKLIHLGAYGLMVYLAIWSAHAPVRLKVQLLIVAGVIVLGGLDEFTQTYVGRMCSVLDWIANVIGATLGFGVSHWLLPRR
ncbi:MAG: VanZ family protein [Phycisphaerae bacterium]|nr:VanZ family protein [Phycisphaerae bacterium]